MHVTKKVGMAAIAAASLVAISLPFAVIANAQQTTATSQQGFGQGESLQQGQRGQGQRGQGGFQGGAIPAPGENFQGGRGGMGGFGGMGGGGSAAMQSDNMFLYVLQGNTIYKIGKGDLKVVGQANLMPMGAPQQMMPPRGGGGQGGNGGNGGGEASK